MYNLAECHPQKNNNPGTIQTWPFPYLSEVKIHQCQCKKLEAHGEAVKQPEGERAERIGRDKVSEVKGKEHRPKRRPEQAEEEKDRLVAEPLVPVVEDQPELDVDEDEEEGIKDRVGNGQPQLHIGRHGGAQSGGEGVVAQGAPPLEGLHPRLTWPPASPASSSSSHLPTAEELRARKQAALPLWRLTEGLQHMIAIRSDS